MNGSKIKNALTRKIGPLPAWAWFVLLGGAYYYYRKYSAASSGTGTGSVTPNPPTPQAGQVLQPGESYYDPNTGQLTTAPGGGDTSGGGGVNSSDLAGLGASMDGLASAIANGMPSDQTPDDTSNTGPDTQPPAGANGTTHGRHSTKATVTPKPKGQPASTASHNISGNKQRSRSGSLIRTNGRATGRVGTGNFRFASNVGKPRSTRASPAKSRSRSKPKTPMVTHTHNQRAEASHPKQSATRQAGHPAPRPSAPAPRTQRAPASPPKPAPRPRPAPKPAPKPPPKPRGKR